MFMRKSPTDSKGQWGFNGVDKDFTCKGRSSSPYQDTKRNHNRRERGGTDKEERVVSAPGRKNFDCKSLDVIREEKD